MDPIHLLLKAILRPFFSSALHEEEKLFLKKNIEKHRKILWLNVCAAALIVYGFSSIPVQNIGIVVSSLVAPVMVLGTAWFTISFGGIPKKLIRIAMAITFWLFASFTISFTTMFLAVGFIVTPAFWPVLIFIYVGALIACIQYDTADGLKVGLDEALLKHSRAALRYYQNQGRVRTVVSKTKIALPVSGAIFVFTFLLARPPTLILPVLRLREFARGHVDLRHDP